MTKELIFIDTSVNSLNNRVNSFMVGRELLDIRDRSKKRDDVKYFAVSVSYEEENNEA